MKHGKKETNGGLDYEVYHFVFETAVEIFEEIFEASKCFPREKNQLIEQVRNHYRPYKGQQVGKRVGDLRRGRAQPGLELSCQLIQ